MCVCLCVCVLVCRFVCVLAFFFLFFLFVCVGCNIVNVLVCLFGCMCVVRRSGCLFGLFGCVFVSVRVCPLVRTCVCCVRVRLRVSLCLLGCLGARVCFCSLGWFLCVRVCSFDRWFVWLSVCLCLFVGGCLRGCVSLAWLVGWLVGWFAAWLVDGSCFCVFGLSCVVRLVVNLCVC